MKLLKTEVTYEEKASRPEVLVRIPYFIILSIVNGVLTPVMHVLMLVQALHILATGKRHAGLYKWVKLCVSYNSRANYYWSTLIDERPPLVPEIE